MSEEREDVETKSSDSPEVYQQTEFMAWFEKAFPWLLVSGAALGLTLMIILPITFFQEKTGDQLKAQSDLRLALLYTTGGVIAALGLLETYRKNTNDRAKANADIKATLKNQEHQAEVLKEQIRQFDENAFKERKAERRERYTKAVEQLGDEKAPIRMGGIYTLVGLVDEWLEEKSLSDDERFKEGQVIINNLCAYIRSPFTLATRYDELSKDSPSSDGIYKDNQQEFYTDKAEFKAEADVRLGIIKEIHDRIQGPDKNTPGAWSDFEYDFSGSIFFYSVDLTNSYYTKYVNFSGSIYQDQANFSRSTYQGRANFGDSTYRSRADFSRSTYQKWTDFNRSTYQDQANFSRSTYQDQANFSRSTYQGEADFSESIYQGRANFGESTYERDVIFSASGAPSTYRGRVDFDGSTYQGWVYFDRSTYEQDVIFSTSDSPSTYQEQADFSDSIYQGRANFHESIYRGVAEFRDSVYWGWADFSGSTYQDWAYFGGSTYEQHVTFSTSDSPSTYKGPAGFRDSTYKDRADFSGSTYEQHVTFSTSGSPSTYQGWANFGGSTYQDRADFSDSIYTYQKWTDFRNSTYQGETDFSGSIFCSEIYFDYSTYNDSSSRFAGCAPQFYDETNCKNTLFGSLDNDFTVDTSEGYPINLNSEGIPLGCNFLTTEQKEYLEDKFQEIDETKNKLREVKDDEEKAKLLDTLHSLNREIHTWREEATTVKVEGTAPEEEDN